jgi:DNA-binding winged helix-turn-helix (wHTH) protein
VVTVYRLGEWRFLPASHELRRAAETVRLEHRAAATLALLCERRGEMVPQRDIIERVWGGRQVSANSVPVVIADLRRALGDDARRPRFVETVSKGGYRLIAAAPETTLAPAPRRHGWYVLTAILILSLGGAAALLWSRPHVPVILVEEVRNATGDPKYAALAAASGEAMIADLARHPEIALARGAPGPAPLTADIRLTRRLVLWNDLPELSVAAVDTRTGKVVWANGACGEPRRLPLLINRLTDDFVATMRSRK